MPNNGRKGGKKYCHGDSKPFSDNKLVHRRWASFS